MPRKKTTEQDSIVEKAEEQIKKTAKKIEKKLEETVEDIKEETREIVEEIKEKVEETVENLAQEEKEIKKKSKENKQEESAMEKAEEITKKIIKKTSEGLEKTAEKIEKRIEKVGEEIKETVEKLREEEKKSSNKEIKKEKISNDKKEKLKALKEKAKELEKKVSGEEVKTEDIKKKVKDTEEVKVDTLVPIEDYLKSSIHLGTRVITPDMKQYVYKRRADGLAVFNTAILDEKVRGAADFLAEYSPKDAILVCKREAGWKAVNLFSQITGIRAFTKGYPAGILTNPNLEEFMETELVVICDPWIDKNALDDARRIKIPVLAICDTNNYTQGVTKILPGNNKSAKSLGIIFYLLAKIYTEKRKIKAEIPPISEWIENWDTLEPPK